MSPARRPWWFVPLTVLVLDAVLLLSAVGLGLGIPSFRLFEDIAKATSLDYSTLLGELSPLRAAYLAEQLGIPLPDNGSGSPEGPISPAGTDAVSGASGTNERAAPGRPERTIVRDPELENDHFDRAYPVQTLPFTGDSTSSASREPGDPVTCEPFGDTIWFRYRPDRDIGLLANTFGSAHPTAVAVFTGDGAGTLAQVECDVSSAGNAQVVFPGKEGVTYHFQVTRQADAGRVVFNLDPLGETTQVSLSSGGEDGNAGASYGTVSADGRFVAFQSVSDNLVTGDGNKRSDIFVRDIRRERTERVSVSSSGAEARDATGVLTPGAGSWTPAISGNGRYVAFVSSAPNLVPGDHNHALDVFVHDRDTGRTERVSVSSEGREGQRPDAWRTWCHPVPHHEDPNRPLLGCWATGLYLLFGVSISSTGRYVLFASELEGIAPDAPRCTDPGNGSLTGDSQEHLPGLVVAGVDTGFFSCRQIYLHDRRTHETTLVSRSSEGEAGAGDSSSPFISPNGRWIVFASDASNLVQGDVSGFRDVFVHDRLTGRTELASRNSRGEQGNEQSGGATVRGHATISNDGRWVAFISNASNLAEGDENVVTDVFLRDLVAGKTFLVSGAPGDSLEARASKTTGGGHSYITADGRYVTFTSVDPEPGFQDVRIRETMVYDHKTRTTTVVSLRSSGEQDDGIMNLEPEISSDGHYVVFHSDASNLDGRDRDGGKPLQGMDVFIHELPWTR